MKNTEWNDLRAKLHHDWLQNRYLTFLMARAAGIDETLKQEKAVREDILEQFMGWQERAADFEALINEAVSALGPAQLLDEYPLNQMAEENKSWLKEVIHALYIQRTGMKEKIESIRSKFNSVSSRHMVSSKILKRKLEEKNGEYTVKKFHYELQEFSKMLSSLPHEVQVV